MINKNLKDGIYYCTSYTESAIFILLVKDGVYRTPIFIFNSSNLQVTYNYDVKGNSYNEDSATIITEQEFTFKLKEFKDKHNVANIYIKTT